jgi:hypothetical protein
MAEVVPLLKDGDREIADNNRPVSLLIAVSKICERVVLNQLTDYMSKGKDILNTKVAIENYILREKNLLYMSAVH